MEIIVSLGPCEDAVILTEDGEFAGVWTKGAKEAYQNADAIQEIMCDVMKDSEHREGVWLWTIMKKWRVVLGNYLGEYE